MGEGLKALKGIGYGLIIVIVSILIISHLPSEYKAYAVFTFIFILAMIIAYKLKQSDNTRYIQFK